VAYAGFRGLRQGEGAENNFNGISKTTDGGRTWNIVHQESTLPSKKLTPSWIESRMQEGGRDVFFDTPWSVSVAPTNTDICYATDLFRTYRTLDGGKTWHRLKGGLPRVPVHDLIIHPRERDLVIGTHGRSVYVMNIAPLEELTDAILAKDAHLFALRNAQAYVPAKVESKSKSYVAPNPPVGAEICYYLKDGTDSVVICITNSDSKEIARLQGPKAAGLQRHHWNLQSDGTLLPAGEYSIRLEVNGKSTVQKLMVE
jgi:hypothetical protein